MSRRKLTDDEIRHKRSKIKNQGYGPEPTWERVSLDPHDLEIQIGTAINWYNATASPEKKKRWLLDYLKTNPQNSNVVQVLENAPEKKFDFVETYLARMLFRGAKLPQNYRAKLTAFATALYKEQKAGGTPEEPKQHKPRKKHVNKIDPIVTRIFDSIDEAITEFINIQMPLTLRIASLANSIGATQQQTRIAIDKFHTFYDDILGALDGDEYLREAYSNCSTSDLMQLKTFIAGLYQQVQNVTKTQEVKKRKKRKVKPENLVRKVKFLNTYKIPGTSTTVESFDPQSILGAKEVWIFNTKYRKLGAFYAKNEEGLSVKGTTLRNYDETKAYSKTIRKPAITIPTFLAVTKGKLEKWFSDLGQPKREMRPRLNKDTLLIRVMR